ncbi:hypothetical protein HanHA300_Chr05g0171681 [Helianthus annuus]|nr:hypothetical protein HanHA300_Chr05g0171681 [Helianthus annuus]KAJ0584211.1 hypothetical protein HanHA89_Chr05g0185941 [Helianthus annuus]KAJ0749880.1 hypothetical protein HanLR1_Chr05g0175341 [Helianthus annuus]
MHRDPIMAKTKDKEVLPDSDDDFEPPVKKLKLHKTNKKQKIVNRKQIVNKQEPLMKEPIPFIEYHHTSLKLRSTPSVFMEGRRKFTPRQVADVKSMGFGSVSDMEINNISTHLGYRLLVNYDEVLNVLNLGNHTIQITTDRVHKVFGIPKSTNLVVEKNKPRKCFAATIDEFKNQWPINRVTHWMVSNAIERQRKGGGLFKLNFLVYWDTIFVEITKSTTINQHFCLQLKTMKT